MVRVIKVADIEGIELPCDREIDGVVYDQDIISTPRSLKERPVKVIEIDAKRLIEGKSLLKLGS